MMIVWSRWTLIVLAVVCGANKVHNGNHIHHHKHHNETINSTSPPPLSPHEYSPRTEMVINITGPTSETITDEPDIDTADDVVYLLFSEATINGSAICPRCRENLIICQNTSSNFTTMIAEGPIRPKAHHYSSLIRYRQERGMLRVPLEVTDDFLFQLVLLHNNTEQLRVLLTLLRSIRGEDWMSYLAGYNECGHPNSNIFTCVHDVCTQHDLLRLEYTNDLFVEDVIGFELFPPVMAVLVLLRNKATKTSGVVRLKAETVSLLDATYNLVRTVFDDIPGLGRDLIETLYLYRERFPAVFSISEEYRARTFPHHIP